MNVDPVSPGAFQPHVALWEPFPRLAARFLQDDLLVVADERVLGLHPAVRRALRGRPVAALRAGERTKSLATVEKLAKKSLQVSRQGLVVALGGGTIGDVSVVFAHLLKRGVTLVQVPSTLLAAVDSSIGGKGAVNVGRVKNALGAFHFPHRVWICRELFETLSEAQRREGRIEAWKVALLDDKLWARWIARAPDDDELIREAQRLKAEICEADPYERLGVRTSLNLGHTFGHVIEEVTGFRVRHGEAVGLGLLCALDVSVSLGLMKPAVAKEIEAAFPQAAAPRRRLASAFDGVASREVEGLLRSDKKGGATGVNMVLLGRPGVSAVWPVPPKLWRSLFASWKRGVVPAAP